MLRIEKPVSHCFNPSPKDLLSFGYTLRTTSRYCLSRCGYFSQFCLKLHLKLPWDVMLGGEAPRWQIKDRIRRKRPGSEQAQLDTPIPPVCPESHSSRSSSSLEHSADETISSVVCRERDGDHTNAEEKVFTAPQPFHPRISLLTHTALSVLQLHISTRSVTFYRVYHSLLHALSTSADNCFPSPPPHPASRYLSAFSPPQSVAPTSQINTVQAFDLCRQREGCSWQRTIYTLVF